MDAEGLRSQLELSGVNPGERDELRTWVAGEPGQMRHPSPVPGADYTNSEPGSRRRDRHSWSLHARTLTRALRFTLTVNGSPFSLTARLDAHFGSKTPVWRTLSVLPQLRANQGSW